MVRALQVIPRMDEFIVSTQETIHFLSPLFLLLLLLRNAGNPSECSGFDTSMLILKPRPSRPGEEAGSSSWCVYVTTLKAGGPSWSLWTAGGAWFRRSLTYHFAYSGHPMRKTTGLSTAMMSVPVHLCHVTIRSSLPSRG